MLSLKACVFALGACSLANAAVIQISDPSGLNQGPYTMHDFESDPGGPGATYSASSGTVGVVTALGFTNGSTPSGGLGLSTTSYPSTITISFANAISSMGFWFGNDDTCCASVFDLNLDLYNGAVLMTTLSMTANLNDFADQFIGFNTTAGETFTSVAIRYGSGSDVLLYPYIDDVYFNEAITGTETPEPTTMATVGLALMGMGFWKRRSRI